MESHTQNTNPQETLRKTISVLLRLMGFSDVAVVLRQEGPEEPLTLVVSMEDAGILIGEQGVNLRAFEYVAKLVVRKILPDAPKFLIDVNNYRRERLSELLEFVRAEALHVAKEGREIELPPMSAFERRAVHLALTSRPDVTTESTGEGVERRVVIKPFV